MFFHVTTSVHEGANRNARRNSREQFDIERVERGEYRLIRRNERPEQRIGELAIGSARRGDCSNRATNPQAPKSPVRSLSRSSRSFRAQTARTSNLKAPTPPAQREADGEIPHARSVAKSVAATPQLSSPVSAEAAS